MRNNIIGKKAKITKSNNKELIGIEGTVRDETKNTILIDNKKIIKNQVTLEINGKETTVTSKNTSERIKVKK